MKTTFTLLLIAMQAISLAAAGPTDLPLGVEVREEHGSLVVREVSSEGTGLEKRCRECVHVGDRCTIGHGSCYAREQASCTWCGNHCKSICIPNGESCQKWCL
ncbi:hypothetical protein MCOR27_002450 [Pyricularia oryzae]|uniref:Uncharacterized protein n=2 Tax=Pyricularia TaxID=48558 RepID=A0ABQ8NJI5_PYRGI|nr:hypothetical protein MCOR01_002608 [Pyricularia oryzae]KAI6298020.1 hypothetical protein MCOR33_005809 [Pyricularia grisea]KAH9433172.1 hypothetical protein MCOR02_007837 [Pyricularia oryzae]KAI6252465.1 hypothetical protein MCOR19_010929 [Pyricularia oryzae]KAI6267879.1 hypothetical protein MCOR34_011772 [Pyricularia oryzae]